MLSSNPSVQDIFRARLFEEPLVPIGGEPTPAENSALAAAVLGYAKRSEPDDVSCLTSFLDAYPDCHWNSALLTNLGLEYYHTGHYSKALATWAQAWDCAREAKDLKGKAIADRAYGELVAMHARVGHMTELEALLKSTAGRVFAGPATERICGAREGLANMQFRPETAFRCGPLALHQIKLAMNPQNPGTELIQASASTQKGFTLRQLAELSQSLGLYFQMAHREPAAAIVVPSVVHLKLDHYAALVRHRGDRYLLQDPTFRNNIWVTAEALEAESSGYFLIPPGELADGWRDLDPGEGDAVHGKGNTNGPDPDPHGPCDPHTGNSCQKDDDNCKGMAVPRVHLLLVNLNINDEPVGYSPPVGPSVRFIARYNQREARQSSILNYSNLGPKWTFDWLSYITDVPMAPDADVTYYIMGGGTRTFTGFDDATGSFAFQQLDQTKLIRRSPTEYRMISRDGTEKVFGKPEDASGTKRRVYLTQLIDPFGKAVSLTYDADLRIVGLTDAIGKTTTLSYDPTHTFSISKVTDPFTRFADFLYDAAGRLIKITDVAGISSEFAYDDGDFINTLTTPYGVTAFTKGGTDNPFPPRTEPYGDTHRSIEIAYPDSTRERVEFNQDQTVTGIVEGGAASAPGGVRTLNKFLAFRNTFYWSRQACAYAYGDYSKAKLYHWLHTPDKVSSAGILESMKEPLEGRIWYDYAGQSTVALGPVVVGSSNQPQHVGRVLDDGSTQLHCYEYNGLGNVTKKIDPVGRTFSYLYAANGVDLLEVRQTRADQNELLARMTYNGQHRLLTTTDAAGQTTTFTYNTSNQILTETNAKSETTTYAYDDRGFLSSVEGPLPGALTTFTHDALGRVRTKTDMDGYTLTFEYDDLDRPTRITYPDGTATQSTYTNLDLTLLRDRAGRQTSFEYNSMREMIKRTDPLGRTTLFQWCKCGALKKLTDPMGRSTTWRHDIQGRVKSKEYADGSKIVFLYEGTTSRLRQKIDEQLQVTQYSFNRDDTVNAITYSNPINPTIPTPPVSYAYDASYLRLTSMADGIGTTLYTYYPIPPVPQLGAGKLAATKGGPLFTEKVAYTYDELGRSVSREIDGATSSVVFDAGGRVTQETNALGAFDYTYDGQTTRLSSMSYPNGQTTAFSYLDNLSDRRLGRIVHMRGISEISEFRYTYDVPAGQIATWFQQFGPDVLATYRLGYDDANQLLFMLAPSVVFPKFFGYTYDPAGNRLTEENPDLGDRPRQFFYNALNELTTSDPDPETPATLNFDVAGRLVRVESGDRVTEFRYDGFGRRVGIRDLVDKGRTEVSNRSYVWCGSEICEERVLGPAVKRFFGQGVKIETGAAPGKYFYTRDHLGSVRELVDDAGAVRAEFDYSPFGEQHQSAGDVASDFGFTGHFFHAPTSLHLAPYRAYDANLGRWLSRDPLDNAETSQGPNLYSYVENNPVNNVDSLGLECKRDCELEQTECRERGVIVCGISGYLHKAVGVLCGVLYIKACFIEKRDCDQWNKAHGF